MSDPPFLNLQVKCILRKITGLLQSCCPIFYRMWADMDEESVMQSHFDGVDVAIVGAGLAGLVCAQALRQQGLEVVVVEKSRGLGGRLATRRLPQGFADHGVRYLEAQGNLSRQLIQVLLEQGVIHPWTTEENIQRYASAQGMTAAAKFLAHGLKIHRGQRVQSVAFDRTWDLTLEPVDQPMPNIRAKTLVMAVPAPQALALLEPLAELPEEFVGKIRSLTFDPCITAIATYPSSLELPPWQALASTQDPTIAWVCFENSKSPNASHPVLTVQSNAAFAEQNFDAEDLQAIGQQLLDRVASRIALPTPDILQVHRWRYAFARNPLPETCLSADSLVCAGDWCGGRSIESALRSGLSAAAAISQSESSFSALLNAISCA
jgi:renalase